MLRINKIDCVTEKLNAKRLLKSTTVAADDAADAAFRGLFLQQQVKNYNAAPHWRCRATTVEQMTAEANTTFQFSLTQTLDQYWYTIMIMPFKYVLHIL